MIRSRAERAPDDRATARGRERGHIMMVIRRLNGRAGGAERLFCDVANLFADAGYAVTVVTCDRSTQAPVYRLSPRITRLNLHRKWARRAPWYAALDGVAKAYPTVRALAPTDWLAKNLYFLRRLHRAARDARPDVMISFLPPANTVTLLAGWLAGARVIATNHSVPAHDYQSDTRWDQNPIDKALRRLSLRAAARIHVLFPTYGAWFPRALQDRIVAIPNAVSQEFLDAAPPRPRRKVIIGVGRLIGMKNYDQLVEAWALLAPRHPDWSLELYGHGPDRDKLQAKIDELGVGDRATLKGDTSEIKAVYLESEVLCHPAEFEGFGLSVAEALVCGVPVVAYADCAGVNELVKHDDNGWLVDRAGGVRALADGLERLITDEPLRHRLRARCRASLHAFRPEAFRDRWLRLVADVTDRAHDEERTA